MAQKNPQKNQPEKPTPEQLKKLKKKPTPEKKPPFPFLVEEKEDSSTGSQTEEKTEETDSLELEKICGNLWFVLYQLGGILKKGFEPLTDDVKNLLAPPSARMAVKYHVQDYMKDEFLLLGILGIDISKRLIKKKPKEKEEEWTKKS